MLARGNIILAVVLILLFVGAIPIVLYITTKDEKTQANNQNSKQAYIASLVASGGEEFQACPNPNLIGNGECNPELDIEECQYDGEDCVTTTTTTTVVTQGTPCPDWSLVQNGVCNKATNLPQCVYDGGDCLGWTTTGSGLLLRRVNGFFKWNAALEACQEIGGHIFEPRHKNHTDELWYMTYDGSENTYVWTGINDKAKNGEYVYESTGQKVAYDLRWYALEPSNTVAEKFVYYGMPDEMFFDGNGQFLAKLICQKSV